MSQLPEFRVVGIAVLSAMIAGCSADSSSPAAPSVDASAAPNEKVPPAVTALSRITSRFGAVFESRDVAFGSLIDKLDRRAGMIEAHLVEAPAQLDGHYAQVRLGEQADRGFTIRDVHSGLAARVVLSGALPVEAQIQDSMVLYPHAHPTGADLIHRPTLGGTEDWLHYDESTRATEVEYDVALGEGVAGVRLVSDTFELLDEKGAPRIHMEPPFVIDAAKVRHPAHLGVSGCAYDSDPRGPWDRPVRAPGAGTCRVRVSWEATLSRPLLVDPMWTVTAAIGARIVALGNGKILGTDNKVYDPATWTAAATGSFNVARSYPTLTLLGTGKVLAVGSAPGNCLTNEACKTGELYNPTLGTWAYANGGHDLTATTAVVSYSYHTANLLSTGKVLLCGGQTGSSGATNTCNLYDPVADTCSMAPGVIGPRGGHTAVALANGKILAAGGANGSTALATAALYDPATNAWTAVNPMSTARMNIAGVRLASGKVLVGGSPTCELFDPSSNGWTSVGSMISALAGGSPPRPLVLLGNGKVIGTHGIFDAGTNTWSIDNAGTSFATGGAGASEPDGLLLSNGNVYFSNPVHAELYDPNTTLGAACTTPAQCPGGHCVDGVCCQSACNQFSCQACSAAKKGQGTNGTCGNVMAGLDPDSECVNDGASTCGRNGFCDGAGACQLYPTNTVCGATTCSGGTLTGATCSASHVCTPGSTSCGAYACANATACATSCNDDAACIAAAWCQVLDHTCQPDKSNGGACTLASQCISGNCVDGFCCDSPCAGTCQACSAAKQGAGTNGICGPIRAGADPDGECPDDGVGSCKRDGFCSGSGSCEQYPAGSSCGATSCVAGVQTGFACNGLGTCNPSTTTACSPYVCANATTCATSCNDDNGCITSAYCRVSDHTCQTDQVKGSVCTIGSQCASGNCVDGFCCDAPCAGSCQACSNTKTAMGNGTCAPVKNATDPDGECPDDGAASCGRNGLCDGIGACQKYASGTLCGPTTCKAGTQTGYSCNGVGTCQPAQTSECSPYLCNGQACGVTCGTDADCVASAFCDATSHCVADKANAASCTKDSQCSSGHCADGVCCDQACGGTCQACTKAKKGTGLDGTCGNIAAGTDPDNECPSGAPTSCKLSGTCNGKGGCKSNTAGTRCAPTDAQAPR